MNSAAERRAQNSASSTESVINFTTWRSTRNVMNLPRLAPSRALTSRPLWCVLRVRFPALQPPGAAALMHACRTHTCGQLRAADVGARVRLSGWVHRKRDHGHLLFVDLRDHYGITQCVIDMSSPLFKTLEGTRLESVSTITGTV